MMKLCRLWLGAAALLMLAACETGPNDGNLPISVDTKEINSLALGEEIPVVVTSGEAWTINDLPDWIEVTPSSGSKAETDVLVKILPNYGTSERGFVLEFIASASKASVQIKQACMFGDGAGDGTEANPYNVAAVAGISGKNENVYVKGTIVGNPEFSDEDEATYMLSDVGETRGQVEVPEGLYFYGRTFANHNEVVEGDEVIILATVEDGKIAVGSKIFRLNGNDLLLTFEVEGEPEIIVEYEATSVSVRVASNVAWTVSVDAGGWSGFTCDKSEGTNNGVINFSFPVNTVAKAHTAIVTVSTTENLTVKSYTVKITQKSIPTVENPGYYEVTEELTDWTGRYLMIYDNGDGTGRVLLGQYGGASTGFNRSNAKDITFDGSGFVSKDNAMAGEYIDVAKYGTDESIYSIKCGHRSEGTLYLYCKDGSTGLHSLPQEIGCKFGWDSGIGVKILSQSKFNQRLQYRITTGVFNFGGDHQPIKLFKYTE